MKLSKIFLLLFFILSYASADAQFLKKLGKAAERAAKNTVERRAERETEKRTDAALDSVLTKKEKKKRRKKKEKNAPIIGEPMNNDTEEPSYEINRASDFTPGNVILFQDAFEKENQGDFPAQWDTNGSGEITLINGDKWMRLGGTSVYFPMLEKTLPENFTVEFDLLTQGLDNKTSSQSWISVIMSDDEGFDKGKNSGRIDLSPCQFISSPGHVWKFVNGKRQIYNQIGRDYRDVIQGKTHISIAVNKSRIRLWMNENKLVDVPRLIPQEANQFKLAVRGLRDASGVDEVFINNFRITTAGEDNRSKLITEGRLSTNAILFESGSDQLMGSSYTVIREIVQVLEENPSVNIQIIGHTDADGTNEGNLTLSRKRAQAVKKAMTVQYGISENRITTDGLGESKPIASNDTEAGKAQNRRVEFIKL